MVSVCTRISCRRSQRSQSFKFAGDFKLALALHLVLGIPVCLAKGAR